MNKILIIATTLSLLASCSVMQQTADKLDVSLSKSVCDILPPISYSQKLDTPETVAQIRSNNAKRNAFCNPTQGATK